VPVPRHRCHRILRREAIDILFPYFEASPARFAQWTAIMLRDNAQRWKGGPVQPWLQNYIERFDAVESTLDAGDD